MAFAAGGPCTGRLALFCVFIDDDEYEVYESYDYGYELQ